MIEDGLWAEVVPKREGRKALGATAKGRFGRDYYCQPGLWPEACAGGRREGPVAPDGHPARVACEKQFLELDGPLFTLEGDGGSHMSMDPWIVLDDVNQNHPRNVRNGTGKQFEDHPSWRKEEHGGRLYIVEGQVWWATFHGKGKVCASAKDATGRKCLRIDH
jgi:hypothetical protein